MDNPLAREGLVATKAGLCRVLGSSHSWLPIVELCGYASISKAAGTRIGADTDKMDHVFWAVRVARVLPLH